MTLAAGALGASVVVAWSSEGAEAACLVNFGLLEHFRSLGHF